MAQDTMNYKARQTATQATRTRKNYSGRRGAMLLVASIGLVVGTLSMSTHYHTKEVYKLNCEIEKLQGDVEHLTTFNQELSESLQQANDRLSLFMDPGIVRAAAPQTYDIPLSEELQEFAYNRCVDYGIPAYYDLVLAVMWQESNYSPDLVSSTADYGIMQINVLNHQWLHDLIGTTDFLDAKQNINAGTFMLAKLLHKYGDTHKALMAYNMGESGAAAYWQVGIYTSTYSEGVLTKRAELATGSY